MATLRIRKYLKIGKPSVKGGIMVLFGIFNSRLGIGVEIFTINLIYGPLAYLFLSLSGIIIIKLLQILDNPSYNGMFSKKRALMIFGVLYLIGLILTIVNVIENMILYYFNIVIIFFTISIGILWSFLGFIGYKNKMKVAHINILIVSLTFSIGLIYGAFLNTLIIPIYIYFFFLSTFFLQLSRELMKGFKINDITEGFIGLDSRTNQKKVLKVSLLFQILAIVFFILPIYSNISYPILFIVLMITCIFFISLAGILTLESILENNISHKIRYILKIGIFIELLTIPIIGS